MPLVSVIMSVYNDSKYLPEAIKSILNQTFKDFELLIVDDASIDNTQKIIESYQLKDDRVKFLINEENLGLTINLNTMIKISKGDFIVRMDSDDVSSQDRISKQLKVFQKNPEIDLVFTENYIIDDYGRLLFKAYKPNKFEKIISLMRDYNYIPHSSVMLSRNFFYKYGFYDESFIVGQDHELWIRALNQGAKFYFLRIPLISIRINPDSVRSSNKSDYEYTVSKYCLINNQKKCAIKVIKKSSLANRLSIRLRSLIPFTIYKYLIYSKNKYLVRKMRLNK